MSSSLEVYRKIQEVYNRFLEARSSTNRIAVTEIAKKYGFRHGSVADPKVHNWFKMDIFDVVKYDRYACSFPLAWKNGNCWIYGVPDLMVFEHGTPVEVWEVKTYVSTGGM